MPLKHLRRLGLGIDRLSFRQCSSCTRVGAGRWRLWCTVISLIYTKQGCFQLMWAMKPLMSFYGDILSNIYIYVTDCSIQIWSTAQQNQQDDVCLAKNRVSLVIQPVVIRVFTFRMKKPWVLSYPLSAQRRLIRLGLCPGWSESSLGAHAISLVLSWGGTIIIETATIWVTAWQNQQNHLCTQQT